MAISKNVFIHNSDKAALAALKAIPGFTQVMKLFMKYWSEENMHVKNMATKIRLSEKQMPQIYNLLPPICDKLGIEIPELYLELNPYPNAYTTGDTKAAITITSSMLETIPEELLPTVIAHECGHIACHHVLYTTMGLEIINGILRQLPLDIVKTVIEPVRAAVSYWMRCSEYSADRAAILCDGTPDKTFELCMRLAGYDKDIMHGGNIDEFFEQAKEYKEYANKNVLNKARELYQFYLYDHPVNSIRALEAKEWANSEDFIKAKQYFESYKASEQPSEIPLPWNKSHFTGRNYEEVISELEEIGFEVEPIRKTDKNILLKDGNVTDVLIGGSSKYKEGDWVSINSVVEVKYYKQLTEEEIQAMHPGEVRMPNASSYYIGKDYKEVEMELFELGLANTTSDYIKDIKKPNDKNIGKVASIIIDKKPKFSKGDWINVMSEVEITYHELID